MKNYINNLSNLIISKIKTFYSNLITKPIQKKRKEKAESLRLKEIETQKQIYFEIQKDKFEMNHKTEIDRVKKLMFNPNPNTFYYDKIVYHNEQSKIGRENIVKGKEFGITSAPFNFDPEIVDMHNENRLLNSETLNELILNDKNKGFNKLKRDEALLNGTFRFTPINITRISR